MKKSTKENLFALAAILILSPLLALLIAESLQSFPKCNEACRPPAPLTQVENSNGN